jgi:L-histidine N-alpha-methyltransferase
MTSSRVASLPLDASSVVERRRAAILADVEAGFSRTPRELPPKYFYDQRGSELFEEITRLPEYYLTRAEREILVTRADDIVSSVRPRTLVELGAGSAAKTRILIAAMRAQVDDVTYMPVDVSRDFLEETRAALLREDRGLRVEPIVADIGAPLDLPPGVEPPVLFVFLGSTIGNFDSPEAVGLLKRIRAQLGLGDRLLLGTDLRKDANTLNAAYNDAQGVTAEFNRNMLRVLNAELGANFDPERFEHRAVYNEAQHRIEMYLRSSAVQLVRVPGMAPIVFHDGEVIRTELSHKYDRPAVSALAAAACLRVERWMTDSLERFALSILEPVT